MDPTDYVKGLTLEAPVFAVRVGGLARSAGASGLGSVQAAVNMGAVISFTDNLTEQERDDVLESVQLAQRAAGGEFDRFEQTEQWYRRFSDVLQRLGWTVTQAATLRHEERDGELKLDKHALQILAEVASGSALGVLTKALGALEKMADDSDEIELFTRNAIAGASGNLQLGAVERGPNNALSLGLGALYFRARDNRRRVLFVSWGSREIDLWSRAEKMTLSPAHYALVRAAVKAKLGTPEDFIAGLRLAD